MCNPTNITDIVYFSSKPLDNINYEAYIDYAELPEEEGEIDENGYFEADFIEAIKTAPFIKDVYRY